jgi:hypothetical protein
MQKIKELESIHQYLKENSKENYDGGGSESAKMIASNRARSFLSELYGKLQRDLTDSNAAPDLPIVRAILIAESDRLICIFQEMIDLALLGGAKTRDVCVQTDRDTSIDLLRSTPPPPFSPAADIVVSLNRRGLSTESAAGLAVCVWPDILDAGLTEGIFGHTSYRITTRVADPCYPGAPPASRRNRATTGPPLPIAKRYSEFVALHETIAKQVRSRWFAAVVAQLSAPSTPLRMVNALPTFLLCAHCPLSFSRAQSIRQYRSTFHGGPKVSSSSSSTNSPPPYIRSTLSLSFKSYFPLAVFLLSLASSHWRGSQFLKDGLVALPDLPSKQAAHVVSKYSDGFVAKRQRRLSLWLQHIAAHPACFQVQGNTSSLSGHSKDVTKFVVCLVHFVLLSRAALSTTTTTTYRLYHHHHHRHHHHRQPPPPPPPPLPLPLTTTHRQPPPTTTTTATHHYH